MSGRHGTGAGRSRDAAGGPSEPAADEERNAAAPPRTEGEESRDQDRRAEAPPVLPETPECPFCSGIETELVNAFGSHASVSTFWCRACRSPFEVVKWRG